MIYHLFDASPYATKFMDFLEAHPEHFDITNHWFILHNDPRSPFSEAPRENTSLWVRNTQVWRILSRVRPDDKVIVHGLFNVWVIWYMIVRPRLARQSTWVAWGADIYSSADNRQDFKHRLVVASRKVAARRISTLVTMVEGDLQVARQVYGFQGIWLSAFYPIPTELERAARAPSLPEDGSPRILVGNSGAATNNHLPILRTLATKYSPAAGEIEVVVPLSYGDLDYIERVKDEGEALLGGGFRAIEAFIPPEEYVTELQGVRLAIMNHERQQGLGTILALLALRKKVYLRAGTTTDALSELGVQVGDTSELAQQSLDEILEFDCEVGEKNSAIVLEAYSKERLIEGWLRVFKLGDGR